MPLDGIQSSAISGDVRIEPVENLYDPVSKFRVSLPETLIDTDFEYGLQPTKWETIELVNNIPTFFARQGEETLPFGDMTTTNGSNIVTVTTSLPHNLNPGSPIIVIGSKNITCDGTFIVSTVLSNFTFQYRAKNTQNFTGSVKDTYTEIYPGSVYQGTLFDSDDIVDVVTDGANGSTITVTTDHPVNFSNNTSFFLLNSLGTSRAYVNAQLAVANGYTDSSFNVISNGLISGGSGFNYDDFNLQVHDWKGSNTFTFTASNITISNNTSNIIFAGVTTSGITTDSYYLYDPGPNSPIPGVTPFQVYRIQVHSSSTFQLYNGVNNATIVVNSSSMPVGNTPHAFHKAYKIQSVNTAVGQDAITVVDYNTDGNTFGNAWTSLQNNPVVFIGNVSSFTPSQNSREINRYKIYYSRTKYSNTKFNFSTSTLGGITDLTSNNITGGFVVPITTLGDRNTIYQANHGLVDNDIITITTGTGTSNTVPNAIGPNTRYVVRKYSDNRFSLLSTVSGLTVELSDLGYANLVITSRLTRSDNESIFFANHGFNDGASVYYYNQSNTTGGTSLGGLIDANVYYIFASTTNNFKLATTSNGYSSNTKTITQNTTTCNVGSSTSVFLSNVHGFSTGKGIRYTSNNPIGGLRSGQHYFVRADTSNTFTLYWSAAGATAGNTADIVSTAFPLTGTGDFIQSEMIDITSSSTGTHLFQSESVGASDGVYNITAVTNSTSFQLTTARDIDQREITFFSKQRVNLRENAINLPDHRIKTGTALLYQNTSGQGISGLTPGEVYYCVKITNDFIKLSPTKAEALQGANIVGIFAGGDGLDSFTTNTIFGEPYGFGTVNVVAGQKTITGNNSNFSAFFKKGSIVQIYYPANTASLNVSAVNTTSREITFGSAHSLTDGIPVVFSNTSTGATGAVNNQIYYVNVSNTTTPTNMVKIYDTYFDSINPTASNILPIDNIQVTNTRATFTYSIGNTFTSVVNAVFSKTGMSFNDAPPTTANALLYSIKSSLSVRADGFALHRPYDGGVELIPSTNPDSSMIRQTRKYFRYQSGKGMQVSLAINFSPSTVIDSFTRVGTTGTIYTRYPHRISVGTSITTSGATVTSGNNFWNHTLTVASVIDPYNFTVTLSGTPVDSKARGAPSFVVNSWNNCALRLGLFDDQNGLFYEYNGNDLYACRRSSTTQLSGTVTTTFRSGTITGTETSFQTQLSVGDYIVIKGQSYKVVQIDNDTQMHIMPYYRGTSSTRTIVTKTVDTKVIQSSWSIDPCDGTGPTGYNLDIHKIQMAYIDYAWYGAGKVRFGFKDSTGTVKYVHEFIHNNYQTEAYLRSGNLPCRYEIVNTGTPTYVPALAHWGTSVIMDGRFDDDKAYLFTAGSNQLTLTGNSTITFTGYIESNNQPYISNTGLQTVGYAVTLSSPNAQLSSVSAGLPISGNNIPASARTSLPTSNRIVPYQPYQPSIPIRQNTGTLVGNRTLMIIDSAPTANATAGQASTYTITAGQDSLVYEIPLLSIRLAPSVDTGTIGALGEREIINRMQLILKTVGILTTHSMEVSLYLNARIDNNNWVRVQNPSLSQLIYHDAINSVTGGVRVYSFRAQGTSGNTARTQQSTTVSLEEIATLGNSILGGDNAYPDGPDVLTLTARLVEDPSQVTSTNPLQVTGRISWTESQA